MTIDSRQVAKVLNASLRPVLRGLGFSEFEGRRAYRYERDCVLGLSMPAVGNHFSTISGFPPASFSALAWVHYNFMPSFDRQPNDSHSRFFPKHAHLHINLQAQDVTKENRRGLTNPADRARTDLWWVEQDGSNLEQVVASAVEAVQEQGSRWWHHAANPLTAVELVKPERECPDKSRKMYFLATAARLVEVAALYERDIRDKSRPGVMVRV